ncbi:MAG TPA: peptidoglycan DD-metalloendopeptidase family protein [Chloroflexota bacterium]|nr:peptidoglycan DD-metalloendopeptidase family protein [Chloroflexota bacterium]
MRIPLNDWEARPIAAPTAPPPPQGGGGSVVPFNAPTSGSFAATLSTLTQQDASAGQSGANGAALSTIPPGVTFTPPATGSTFLGGAGGSPLDSALGAAGSSNLTSLIQGLGAGSSSPQSLSSGGLTPMELVLVPLQGGPTASSLSALLGGQVGTGGATLQMPFQGQAALTQGFGPTSFSAEPAYDGYSHFHTGLDFGVPVDTPIEAAGAGKVVAAGWDSTGYGNRVIIDHGNGQLTLYGHLDKMSVHAGDLVAAGQRIGLSGSTGNSTGPHLHFGLQVNGRWVDPTAALTGGTGAPVSSLLQGLGGGDLTAAGLGTSSALSGGIPVGLVMLPSTTPANSYAAGSAPSGPLADPALSGLITQAAQASGLPSSLVAAVVQTESGGNPQAVSASGAKGLMQLMDGTAAAFGVTNAFDPQQNLSAGTQYLKTLLQKYQGNEQLAVAAYNAGSGAVDHYGGVPPFPETQQYVQKVLSLQQQYGGSTPQVQVG